MSEEQLKAFQAAAEADAGLKEKVQAASDADAVVGIAKAAGFAISAEELLRAQAEEISEAQDLEAICGGTTRTTLRNSEVRSPINIYACDTLSS